MTGDRPRADVPVALGMLELATDRALFRGLLSEQTLCRDIAWPSARTSRGVSSPLGRARRAQ